MDEIAKLAISDAKDRLKAQLDLVYALDRQAMTFFGYTATVTVAGTTAAAGLAAGWLMEGKTISTSGQIAILGLGLVAAGFFFTAAMCLSVMKSWKVALPGREPEFWQWAMEEPVSSLPEIASAYLSQMAVSVKLLKDGSETMSTGLANARGVALASGLIGICMGALAALARN
ncbi:hypothetical protein [Bosea sp. (in: a-proteobacteria)]|uniref:hypothetical protein n=1 Tax=Bosea sp. (in: a-proteobacteria) TaxID=1871050 RepID=UPI002B4A2A6A|nr:hypothetical protein [Bosea sp. (in: a-proteobacteria)]WRH58469.1 MAG: hypothetical protein RSE11_01365 [Bosea sp. (in: a-proteobacteria)]